VRQDGIQLGKGACAGVLDAAHSGDGAKTDGYGDRLVVIQQQRWQLRANAEPVMAAWSAYRFDGIVEVPEALHVIADGASTYLEAPGQFCPAPDRAGLEQAEQRK
jgi:hypothetical protein